MKKIGVLSGLATLLTVSMLCAGCAGKKAAVTIELKENKTTGFEWSYTMEPQNVLKETKNEYVKAKTDVTGAPGMHVWEFEPAGDGTVTLTFTYARPWEGGETGQVIVYSYEVKGKEAKELSRTVSEAEMDLS